MHFVPNSTDWSYPSVNQLCEFQINNWYELGIVLGITKEHMTSIRNSKTSMAEIYLAAKKKNLELSWKNVGEGFVRIGEYTVNQYCFV